jgi:predicted dehydrogenase
MKFFVIGCGSIGERHIRNIQTLCPDCSILATDVSADRLSLMQKKYGVIACSTIDEGFIQNIDAAIICTPPNSHIAIAMVAIKNKVHVFIEKPMSNSASEVENFLRLAESTNLVTFVGYCFRFHAGLNFVKKILESGELGEILFAEAKYGQYLPDWRPWQDYKQSYTAKKALGGGIVLDGSHEIDYIRWLVGEVKEVFCFASQASDLEVETESVAGILLKFKNGSIGTIHLDFVRRDYSRGCEIICRNGTVQWSYEDNTVRLYRAADKKWQVWNNVVNDSNDMYILEMKHFIECLTTHKQPLVTGKEGFETLKIALAAKESTVEGVSVKL